MQYNGSTSSTRNIHAALISEDNLWIAQSQSLTSTRIIKHSEMSLSNEKSIELETHTSSTIFCDMMSPDEWKSSLPVFEQNDDSSMVNSPTSPSNSIENLVLELESSNQDIDMGSPFTQCPDNILLKLPFSDKCEELVCNMDTEEVDMLFGMLGTEKEIGLDAIKVSPVEKQSSLLMTDVKDTNNGIENQLKASSSLSTGLLTTELKTLVLPKDPHTDTVGSQLRAVEELPPKDQKDSSLRYLTSRLAEVIHCNNRDDVSILQKATSKIFKIRAQSQDLMSTYSQLKFQNAELIQQQNLLHSEHFLGESDETPTRGYPMTIEVLIPSDGAKKVFYSTPLYHHIPMEDGQIPTISEEGDPTAENGMDEPYEEQYDAPMVVNPTSETSPCKNKKLSCELGCICSSLQNSGNLFVEHCKNPNCMLEPNCSQSNDPSHTSNTVFSITNHVKVKPDVGEDRLNSKLNTEAVSKRSSNTTKVPVFYATKFLNKQKSALGTTAGTLRRTSKRTKTNDSVLKKDPKINSKDPKLLGDCNVRLTKIDPKKLHQMDNGSFDVKLHSKCFVNIKKLHTKKNQLVFCMNHRLHSCICLVGSATKD